MDRKPAARAPRAAFARLAAASWCVAAAATLCPPCPAGRAAEKAPEAQPAPPAEAGGEEAGKLQHLAPAEAASVLGRPVRGPDGHEMGRIVDVLVDQAGHPRAAVIDFGGFMGVGSRKIAVDWHLLRFAPSEPGKPITLELTPDQIKAAPEYKPGSNPTVVTAPSGNPGEPAAGAVAVHSAVPTATGDKAAPSTEQDPAPGATGAGAPQAPAGSR